MAKREFIEKADIVDKCITYIGKESATMNLIERTNTLTEADIVKPYLDKLKEKLSQIGFDHYFQCGEYLEEDVRKIKIMNFDRAMEIIDSLLSEQGDTE